MNQFMTIEEIEKQFVGEWILVEDPETDEYMKVLSGRVRCHSKDRDEVYEEANQLHPGRFSMVFTGKLAPDTEILL
jgi:hypothetical protein